MTENKDLQDEYTLIIEPKIYDNLISHAKNNNISISEIVTNAIIDYLKNNNKVKNE